MGHMPTTPPVVPPGSFTYVYNVRDYGATGDGSTDDTVAVQAAFAAITSDGGRVLFPRGLYKLTSAITSAVDNVWIEGYGVDATKILMHADSDLFVATSARCWTISNLRIVANSGASMASGKAIKITGAFFRPSVLIRDVEISPADDGEEFKYGIHLTDCGESRIESTVIVGTSSGSTMTGIYLAATDGDLAAGPHKLSAVSVYSASKGIVVENNIPAGLAYVGVEGLQCVNCDLVAVGTGLEYINDATYFPPQITFLGGHVSATTRCIDVDKVTSIFVMGSLLYLSGTGTHIRMRNVGGGQIQGNTMVVIGAGTGDAVDVAATTAVDQGLLIVGNTFILGAGAGDAAVRLATANITNVQIRDNHQTGGTETVGVTGSLAPSIIVADNYPPDTSDQFESVTVGTTISVADKRSTFVGITTPGGATTITTITPRRDGDAFTFKCDSTLVTIEHNAGCILRGGANYTFAAGANITLRRAQGVWQEVGRMEA